MKIKLDKLLFIISYILILIPFTFSQINLDSHFLQIIYWLSIGILMLLFIYQNLIRKNKIKRKTLIILLLLFILSIISSLCIKNTIILRTFLFICCFRNIKFSEYIKCDLIIRVLFVLILFCLFNFGLTESVDVFRDDVMRYSFGFNHPNKFGLYIMLICMELTYLYLKKTNKNIKWILFILISILNFIVYHFANSRASFLIITCCLILILIKKEKIFKFIEFKYIKFLIKNSFLILLIISFSLTLLYKGNNNIALELDDMLSGRLFWASEYLDNYGLTMFGSDLKLTDKAENIDGSNYLILDNSFVFLTLNYGIIFTIVMLILFRQTFKLLYNKKKYICIILLFIYIIYGFMESTLIKFYHNPFLLLLNYTLYKEEDIF